jgi:1-acyl-sn-glycerol-3-phosphate acyltransferase
MRVSALEDVHRFSCRPGCEEDSRSEGRPPNGVVLADRVRVRRARRSVGELVYAVYAWTLLMLIGLPTLAAIVVLPARSLRWNAARAGVRFLLRASRTRLHVEGAEHVPADGPFVVAANHPSYLDPFVLTAMLEGSLTFVAAEHFARQPISGTVLRRLGAEFVAPRDRSPGVTATERLIAAVRSGSRLVLFPEGSLSHAPGLRPFRMGAFVIAARTGVPIIPIAICETRSILPPGHVFFRHGTVRISISEPLEPTGTDWDTALRLHDEARAAIVAHCGEPDLA